MAHSKAQHDNEGRHEAPLAASDFLQRVEAIVERRMSHPDFTLEALASELCMTRGHLNRRVKALTGLTTQQFVVGIRLERARRLLRAHPFASIADVAYHCGYDDATSFTRAFHRRFGDVPSRLRFK